MDKVRRPDDVDTLTLELAREAVRTLRVQVDAILDGNDYLAESMTRWIKSNARTREGT